MRGRALVTGATGMLGGYLCRLLQERGWKVRALVRSDRIVPVEDRDRLELAPGRLEDPRSLVGAARDCDVIFHAAAAIGPATEWECFRRVNVAGTANVVEAARARGTRLVHISSTAVYGRARYGTAPTDEETPLPELPSADAYGRSKQEAERIVLRASRAGRAWVTVVRPPVMYGRADRQFVPRVAPLMELGVFPLLGSGRSTLTVAHARNVAEGALLAASAEASRGRVFLLAHDFETTVRDLVRGAELGLGRRVRALRVPLAAGRLGSGALALVLRGVRRADVARHVRGTFEMLTRDDPFSSRRARDELGWRPSTPPEIGLPDAFRSWRSAVTSEPCAEGAPAAAGPQVS